MTANKTLGIVADDLTGAMDSSGYFASQGFTTNVIIDSDFYSPADVLAINTNSRVDDINTANRKVRRAIRTLAGRMIYKKIDSTLRGNIGAELEAAMEELASEKAIVAPAFPSLGRITINGVLQVDGTRVDETQFADDPVSPIKESHIPTLLEQSTKRFVGCLPLEAINAGPELLYRKISEMPEEIIVCDVTAQSHLTNIAQAAALASGHWLLCGSGGLAREMPIFLRKATKGRKGRPISSLSGPVLMVVGTRNRVAVNQLLRVRDEIDLPILKVESVKPDDVSSRWVQQIVGEASRLLRQNRLLVLSSAFSDYVPTIKQLLPTIMAEMVAGILDNQEVAGLFLSGGDTALSVCRRLSTCAILIHGEIEPGIPAGELVGGRGQGIRVITKAGGFGTETVLIKSIPYLEEGFLT